MQIETTSIYTGACPLPISTRHTRHGDYPKLAFAAAAAIVAILFVLKVATVLQGISVPGMMSVAAWPIGAAVIYWACLTYTNGRWLQRTISIDDAKRVADLVIATNSFGVQLPPVPEAFPDISNGTLRSWADQSSVILESNYRKVLSELGSSNTAKAVS